MKTIFTTLFILVCSCLLAQSLRTDNYELYLNDYVINEVNVSQGMYMTKDKQYFYEGQVEVIDVETNKSTMHQFYFSTWDKGYKEFIVKDAKFNDLQPTFTFKDNNTVSYIDKESKEQTAVLEDNKNVDYAILSSMLIWVRLSNQ